MRQRKPFQGTFERTSKPETVTEIRPSEGVSSGSPEIWGPALWFFLHTTSANYPDNPSPMKMKKTREFICSLPHLIPCENCFHHALRYIESSDLKVVVSSRKNLFEFFVRMHNYVNKRYQKPELTPDQVLEKYLSGNQLFLRYN